MKKPAAEGSAGLNLNIWSSFNRSNAANHPCAKKTGAIIFLNMAAILLLSARESMPSRVPIAVSSIIASVGLTQLGDESPADSQSLTGMSPGFSTLVSAIQAKSP